MKEFNEIICETQILIIVADKSLLLALVLHSFLFFSFLIHLLRRYSLSTAQVMAFCQRGSPVLFALESVLCQSQPAALVSLLAIDSTRYHALGSFGGGVCAGGGFHDDRIQLGHYPLIQPPSTVWAVLFRG